MEIKAEQKYAKISPRKVNLVAGMVKDLSPAEALIRLQFIRKRASALLSKVIKQAIANATNVKRAKEANLRFKSILVHPGPIIKRWRAAAKGRGVRINKRTCHIKVILESKNQNRK